MHIITVLREYLWDHLSPSETPADTNAAGRNAGYFAKPSVSL